MNLNSRQRKIFYLVLIIVLLIPILFLGQPSSPTQDGGILAQKRKEYKLSQSSLGDVEPSSAIMKVVLLGFRGVAADLLWVQAKEQEKKKEWGKYRATTNTILLLQPNFEDVWRYTGWDFSYNVSSQWDGLEDRYYWLKEGGKFLREGADQNQYSAAIQWDIGRVLGQKIGTADESTFYRQFFRVDPDEEQYEGGTDLAFNPWGKKDNYLAAREDYLLANDREEKYRQSVMRTPIFRLSPTKSIINAASAMQREGEFDEPRQHFKNAHDELLNVYGKHTFYSDIGKFTMAADDDEIDRLSEENSKERGRKITFYDVKDQIDYYKTQTQFDYWVSRCKAEEDPVTVQAHKDVYEGKKSFKEADYDTAIEKLLSAMEGFEKVINKYPGYVQGDPNKLDEALEAVLYWSFIYETSPKYTLKPTDYPLKDLWEANLETIRALNNQFRVENQIN